VVYIGKAINIKSRVSSHFSNNSTNKQKQDFLREIHSLSFEETSTELLALILESHEIKAHWPTFNKAQKKYDAKYGLYDYTDRSGIIRLGIEIIGKHRHTKPLMEYSSKTEAIEHIQQMVEVFELCTQFCGVQQVCINSNCDCKQPISLFEYNAKVNDLIVQLSNKESYLIIDKGRTKNEFSAIYVSKGKFIGMGYIPVEVPRGNLDEIIHFIKKYKENFFILKQIELFALANPEKVIEVAD
jgi:DNA polymerase-3 subunit epsilon